MDLNLAQYWEGIYEKKSFPQTSWFQTQATTSLNFIDSYRLNTDAKIIDIGGGDSTFVDQLLEKGFSQITVLDISKNSIEKAKERLGKEKADKVKWIVSDVTKFNPEEKYDLWHDRATFHFLSDDESVQKYCDIATRAVRPNTGHLLVATFSEKGPTQCSGLPVKRYSEEEMKMKFEENNKFKLLSAIYSDHITPFNTTQNFLFCSFQRLSD